MTELRRKAAAGLEQGDRFTVTRRFESRDVETFAAISRDYNPVHFEPRFAASKGFDRTICHGLLVASLLTEVGGQIAWLASGMSFRFKGPVYPGDTVTCSLVIDEVDDTGRARASARIVNPAGETVIEGELFGIIPQNRDQAILKTMLAEGDPTNLLRDEDQKGNQS